MPDHDPYCPESGTPVAWVAWDIHRCCCDLIAKARADERAKNRLFREAEAIRADERERIALAMEDQHERAGGFCCFSDHTHRRLILDARIARNGGTQ